MIAIVTSLPKPLLKLLLVQCLDIITSNLHIAPFETAPDSLLAFELDRVWRLEDQHEDLTCAIKVILDVTTHYARPVCNVVIEQNLGLLVYINCCSCNLTPQQLQETHAITLVCRLSQ